MSDWIAIFPNPLPVEQAIAFVADPAAGGINVFLGTTRAETSSAGQELHALDYEAYEEMALAEMKLLVAQARTRWPIIKASLLHRVGRVHLAEPSVVIAVATPHRAESFDACRFLIDELKQRVPIWKKEIWDDGNQSWVAGHSVAGR